MRFGSDTDNPLCFKNLEGLKEALYRKTSIVLQENLNRLFGEDGLLLVNDQHLREALEGIEDGELLLFAKRKWDRADVPFGNSKTSFQEEVKSRGVENKLINVESEKSMVFDGMS